MNIHSAIDIWLLKLSGALLKNKLFQDINGATSLPYAVGSLSRPAVKISPGFHEITFHTPKGPMVARYYIKDLKGLAEGPVIIYHHGSGEYPCDTSFRQIFRDVPYPAVLVCAPFHDSRRGYFQAGTRLSTYLFMLAVSLSLIQALIQTIDAPAVISGLSLGGFVAVYHSKIFHSARAYIPLLGGTYLGTALVDSAYAYLVSPHADRDVIKEALDIKEAFDTENIYPLWGKYDEIVRPDIQKGPFRHAFFMPRGHITGSLSYKMLRSHIVDVIENYMQRPSKSGII